MSAGKVPDGAFVVHPSTLGGGRPFPPSVRPTQGNKAQSDLSSFGKAAKEIFTPVLKRRLVL